ncbi:MAG: threonine synthase [Deltaproteobacteria bacterium]|jgi:threonine synthase|nr:threonine synthase [Deltaproteobacteria bacterium]MBW2534129.1 threonine synthase [Deltaproteobacteria bacterium]
MAPEEHAVTDSIVFRSTNGTTKGYTLGQALLTGQAPDRGLFMPERIPPQGPADLTQLVGKPYPEIAFAVLRRYTVGQFDDDVLREVCEDAYSYDVPIEKVQDRRYVLRLDMGPTASFKDFAARMMGRWIGRLVKPGEAPLVVLTATSGDTGSAVAQAFAGVDGIECMVLFPVDEVSDRQRKQMTTIGGNVSTIGVDGKFDDCQAMVKRAFADPELEGIRLTSANSINIGRLLPQSVYYVYAYLRLADVAAGEKIVFCVPSGNFGNLCGGLLAHQAGLPVARFVVATNANDEVPIFFDTERYQKIEPSRVCISNAMNVGHPSNLARLVDLYGGQMDETGMLHRVPDMAGIRQDMWSVPIDDDETRRTIADTWTSRQVMLEPHGAVGWAALCRYFEAGEASADQLAVSLETAHPAKFPDEIRALTGIDPELPPSLATIEQLDESFDRMAVDYDAFRTRLEQQYG